VVVEAAPIAAKDWADAVLTTVTNRKENTINIFDINVNFELIVSFDETCRFICSSRPLGAREIGIESKYFIG
jgi:sulfur relay (sulfurtransferase) DsrF/TusC family protein